MLNPSIGTQMIFDKSVLGMELNIVTVKQKSDIETSNAFKPHRWSERMENIGNYLHSLNNTSGKRPMSYIIKRNHPGCTKDISTGCEYHMIYYTPLSVLNYMADRDMVHQIVKQWTLDSPDYYSVQDFNTAEDGHVDVVNFHQNYEGPSETLKYLSTEKHQIKELFNNH